MTPSCNNGKHDARPCGSEGSEQISVDWESLVQFSCLMSLRVLVRLSNLGNLLLPLNGSGQHLRGACDTNGGAAPRLEFPEAPAAAIVKHHRHRLCAVAQGNASPIKHASNMEIRGAAKMTDRMKGANKAD